MVAYTAHAHNESGVIKDTTVIFKSLARQSENRLKIAVWILFHFRSKDEVCKWFKQVKIIKVLN